MPRLRLDPFSPSGVSIVADSPRAKQQNGYVARTEKLSQISDVDALSPSNGQALAYNSTTKTWKPTTISGGTGGGTTLPADAAGWLHDDGIGTLAWTTPAKSDVGLSNVDNTSDVNKPVSTATQTALNAKENSITIGTSAQYYRGDKTMQTLNQDAVPSGTTNKAYTATEQTKLAAITGTNTGDQTLSIAGSNLTISGANGNTIALPASTAASDATTTAKGIVQLAGDLSGTAALPTVPGLAGKVATTITVNGHALSSNVVVSASDLTTGTLPIAQGGTGATATTGSGSNVLATSPSLTTPKADIITDTNGGKEIELVATASSANWVKLTNTVAGSGVTVGVNGTGTNENLTLAAMGTGTVQVGGSQVTTAANTQVVTNKTMSGASNTFSAIPESAVTNLTTDLAAKATDTAVVHLANAEAITGAKTFSSGTLRVAGTTSGTVTLNTPAGAIGTLTLPSATDTLVGQATIDNLSNKTLTSPTITTPIITQSVASITAATTLTTTSAALQYANATTAAFTITLPTTTTAGISFTIVKTDSSANAVTVAGTINGATNYALSTQWSYIQVVSTTTSGTWYIIDGSNAATVAGYAVNATPTANTLLPLDSSALVPRTALAFSTYIKMTSGTQALPAATGTTISGWGVPAGNNPGGYTNTSSGFTLPAGVYFISSNVQLDTTNIRADINISNTSASQSLNQQFGKASLSDLVILTTSTTFSVVVTNNAASAANINSADFTAVRIY